MSEKIAKKTIKNNKNQLIETYDWKRLIYPKDLYKDDDDNKNNIKENITRYELDKDNNLIYIGNYPNTNNYI